MNYNWLSICPVKMEPVKNHPITCGYLTSLRNKPQQVNLGQLCNVEDKYFGGSFNICKIKNFKNLLPYKVLIGYYKQLVKPVPT